LPAYDGCVNDERPSRRIPSLAGLGGAVSAAAVDVLYLRAIVMQGDQAPGGRVPFVAGWIAASALIAGVGAVTHDSGRRALLLAVAAAAMLALAVPALWSIGGPLLLCGLVTGWGAARAAVQHGVPAWQRVVAPVVFVVIAAAILIVGLALTNG